MLNRWSVITSIALAIILLIIPVVILAAVQLMINAAKTEEPIAQSCVTIQEHDNPKSII